MSQNSVRCILQDKQGFMWFGTYDGLNRYDGYEFKIYRNVLGDSFSLSHNSITSLLEDSSGMIWVGTVRGLNRYDPAQGKFYLLDTTDVNSLCLSGKGDVWVGSQDLDRYLIDGWEKNERFYLPGNSVQNNFKQVFSLGFQKPELLWVGTGEGDIFQFNIQKKKFLPLKRSLRAFSNQLNKRINFVLEDRKGNIWFATEGQGLIRYNPASDKITYFTHNPRDSNSISNNWINCLYEDRQGNLWIGSQEGLMVIDQSDNMLFRFKHNPRDPYSLSDDRILSIYQDRFGTYWVGTKGGGINKFSLQNISFDCYLSAAEEIFDPSVSKIWSFYQDRQNTLWIGTSAGLVKARKKNGREKYLDFKFYPIQKKDQLNCAVRSIHEDPSGNLWLALVRGGLAKFNKKEGQVTYFVPDSVKTPCAKPDIFYTLFPIDRDHFWIGTNGCGLLSFNKTTGIFQNLWGQITKSKKITNWVISVYRDREGAVWLGTWKRGLIRFGQKKEEVTVYRHNPNNPFSLSNNTVFSILEDHRGNLWIGTYGGGLNKLNRKTGKFTYYTHKDGLPNDVIYGILEDDRGNLWLSTNKGLSCFNPETAQFINYDVEDGLQGNEFNLGAYFKGADGTLFFGGNNGFNCFKPTNVINQQPAAVVLTGLKKFGKPVKFNRPISHLKKIVLTYKDDFFTFQFAALHYKNPRKNLYAYKLEGFDKDWIYIGRQREASYTNLDPGTYRFRVKAANCDGVWSENELSIPVIIRPPFWQTKWFYLSVLFFFVGGLWVIYKFHLKSQINQALLIERVRVNEREEIQKKISQDFHDELGHRLTKINLFGNLLARELKDAPDSSVFYLQKILHHSQSLFQETRDFIWQLDPKRNTLYDWVVRLKDFSDELFENTDISFRINANIEELDKIILPLDWRMHLLRIFKEALHNVFKHARNCKNVSLEVQYSDRLLEIVLTDDGVGFEKTAVSNGEGLNNMVRRAQSIGGQLKITSQPMEGTEIRFIGKLPERRVDF